ncbi:hypothetical protein A3D11_01825 [Candidatus Peribacteria bacterium RIFCSPHIGHO2_02_FULL_49_16]|nr:MAG: hypothetical protein A2880_00935 [Candidatus Peribacteria bacterium RIFCSPHIGHO2_01_FULL_49_38]OGJ58655.1 MAG: hypothetical protein A3D11_01825 [Candidatus Peribacteria bacterium RIFCSPHIGHO2_02_FULL_49_16]
MYDSLLAILLMGIVPVGSGTVSKTPELAAYLSVAPLHVQGMQKRNDMIQKLRVLSASGVLIIDTESGQELYASAARDERPIASLTKLMTALLITENHVMNEWVTIPLSVKEVPGEVAHLSPGDEFRVGDLLSALLIGSANDAAVSLAEFHSGSVAAFVDEMNHRAHELGLKHTLFQNPVGFDDVMQYSTPQDLAWLAIFVLKNEEIQKRMATRGMRIFSRTGDEIYITHTHALLHADTSVLAGKTGTTKAAGQCLLSLVEGEQGERYLVILLHSNDRYADMRTILRILAS